jgi:hypothetical protein
MTSILYGIELEWNDKGGTIEIEDDQAPNQNKMRVIAEVYDRDFGEEIVDAVNCFNLMLEALIVAKTELLAYEQAMHKAFTEKALKIVDSALAKATA